jgi:hypothetical protein
MPKSPDYEVALEDFKTRLLNYEKVYVCIYMYICVYIHVYKQSTSILYASAADWILDFFSL